jgi:hypothetical protein
VHQTFKVNLTEEFFRYQITEIPTCVNIAHNSVKLIWKGEWTFVLCIMYTAYHCMEILIESVQIKCLLSKVSLIWFQQSISSEHKGQFDHVILFQLFVKLSQIEFVAVLVWGAARILRSFVIQFYFYTILLLSDCTIFSRVIQQLLAGSLLNESKLQKYISLFSILILILVQQICVIFLLVLVLFRFFYLSTFLMVNPFFSCCKINRRPFIYNWQNNEK